MGAKWFGAASSARKTRRCSPGAAAMSTTSLPGMLHAAFVRSPHAHADPRHRHARRAGARACIACSPSPTCRSHAAADRAAPGAEPGDQASLHAVCLPSTKPVFVGEPVAIVVADSRYLAEDAAALVEVDYEPLPAVSDCVAALAAGAPLAHRGSEVESRRRHPDQGRQRRRRLRAGRACVSRADLPASRRAVLSGMPRHDRGAGPYDAIMADALTIYVSSQGPHRHKRGAARPARSGRIISCASSRPTSAAASAPRAASMPSTGRSRPRRSRCGRPIKWIEDRHENFLCHPAGARSVLGHGDRGRRGCPHPRACAASSSTRPAPIMPWGVVLPWIAATSVPGPYVIPNFHLDVTVAFTNKVPTSPVRGAGRPQACVVMERLMDRVAHEVKLDPRRGAAAQLHPAVADALQGRHHLPRRPAGDLRQRRLSDLPGRRRSKPPTTPALRPARRRRAAQGRYIGIGIGNAVEATGLGPYESATARVSTSGKLTRLHRRDPAGPVAQDHARPDRRRHLGVTPDDDHHRDRRHRRDRARGRLVCGPHGGQCRLLGASRRAASWRTRSSRFAADMMEAAEADIVLEDGHRQDRAAPTSSAASARSRRARSACRASPWPAARPPGLESHQPLHARPVDLFQRHPCRRGRGRYRDRQREDPALSW